MRDGQFSHPSIMPRHPVFNLLTSEMVNEQKYPNFVNFRAKSVIEVQYSTVVGCTHHHYLTHGYHHLADTSTVLLGKIVESNILHGTFPNPYNDTCKFYM